MTIIPAIDIIDGKCVRLTKGDYAEKTIYNEDPLEAALQFQDAGIKRLHLVDLDGAKAGEVKNWKVLEKIAGKTSLEIDFSGGISTRQNLDIAFSSGAVFASVGSITITDEFTFSEWILAYGANRFIIGADVINEIIVIKGWTETTTTGVFTLIEKYKLKGIKQFFCTDVNKDGLMEGPSVSLYKKILNRHPSIDLIASGGISSIGDLEELREAGCSGAIIGKALYEKKIRLNQLAAFLS
jgi:phosphoribosylformimino-5-aminoimidazole carboxamide ribotide isomerase